MSMRSLLQKLRAKRPAKSSIRSDWTSGMTPHDWADLPTYHPRRETDAL